MKNRKYISLLAVCAMLIAYAVPFNFGVSAAETVWTFAGAPEGEKLENNKGAMKEWYIGNVDLGDGLMSYSNGTLNSDKQEYSNAFEVDRTSKAKFTVNEAEEEVIG